MAWPRTGTGTVAGGSVAGGDATYFRWGTKDAVTTAGWGYAVVSRLRQSRKKDTLPYENGDGVQSGRMQVFHGVQWELTVRDDSRFAGPVEGTQLTIVDMAGLVGSTYGNCGTIGGLYAATVIDSDYEAAPKQPGERVILCERIKLIEG